jgi:hypothetical protein
MTTPPNGCVRGIYRDRLVDANGRLVGERGWRSNRVVNDCNRLLAALMKGEPGVGGVLYLAVGEGEEAWDGAPPQTSAGASRLAREWLRVPLGASQIEYLGGDGVQPTDQLQITATLQGSVVPGSVKSLREFGLFGGTATAAADSGLLINYVIHPRIDLTPGSTLVRELRLQFGIGPVLEPFVGVRRLPGTAVAGMSARYIDGLGEAYAAMLAGLGITTVAQLADADLMNANVRIPKARLVELQAKAVLAVNSAQAGPALRALAAHKIDRIATATTAALMSATGASEASVVAARAQAAALQVALDDALLERVTLEDLARPFTPA